MKKSALNAEAFYSISMALKNAATVGRGKGVSNGDLERRSRI